MSEEFKTVRLENKDGRVQFAENAVDYHNFVARGYKPAEAPPKVVPATRPTVTPASAANKVADK